MKPILFNTDMVRAILAGKKTVTRRVVKPQNAVDADGKPHAFDRVEGNLLVWADKPNIKTAIKPPCQPGEILYVRETWASTPDLFGEFPQYIYRADYSEKDLHLGEGNDETLTDFPACVKWRPSIHMPKEAARIFLRVKNVRVEKLQEITEEEAKAEGCYAGPLLEGSELWVKARDHFLSVWDGTLKSNTDRDTYGWSANPWVWVIEFERCERPKEAE